MSGGRVSDRFPKIQSGSLINMSKNGVFWNFRVFLAKYLPQCHNLAIFYPKVGQLSILVTLPLLASHSPKSIPDFNIQRQLVFIKGRKYRVSLITLNICIKVVQGHWYLHTYTLVKNWNNSFSFYIPKHIPQLSHNGVSAGQSMSFSHSIR